MKGRNKLMKQQNKLRQDVRIAKALNEDWSYKKMSDVIDISVNAFYNWLNGAYELSEKKERQLKDLVSNLIA